MPHGGAENRDCPRGGGGGGETAVQQFLGDPEVGDTPVRLRKTLRDAQPLQTAVIDGDSGRYGDRWGHGGSAGAGGGGGAGGAANHCGEHEAECSNSRLRRAKPGMARRSFTQGANPLGRRRHGF